MKLQGLYISLNSEGIIILLKPRHTRIPETPAINRASLLWKPMTKKWFFAFLGLMFINTAHSQRSYSANSVLANGGWQKLAVSQPGIYQIDLPFLNSLGINTNGLASASIRIFGNGGEMLPEPCNGEKYDDLQENAIYINDGGDGIFNGSDYILFYANGPDKWVKDSINQRFSHQKNIYSTQSFYFLSVGGVGKRVIEVNNTIAPNISVSSYSGRYFYELDSINFLNSGQNWFGEEMSLMPGRLTSKTWQIPFQNIVTGQTATLISNCIGRSIGNSSRFSISANNSPVLMQDIASTTAGSYDLFAHSTQSTANFTITSNSLSLQYQFQPGNPSAQGWLDWFEVFTRNDLSISGNNQLLFRDWISVGTGKKANFQVRNSNASTQIWDVTDPLEPVKIHYLLNGTTLSFNANADYLHEYIAFSDNFLKPVAVGKMNNQNLHAIPHADMLVLTSAPFLAVAQQLATFHKAHDNLNCVVVTVEQVFNEFSSGTPDPTAIRDFVKMLYDKSGGNAALRPKYLLLFGDASFDFKGRVKNNTNFVPAYQSVSSLDPLSTLVTDDYFGLLDDSEDINRLTGINLLDIGIGRIPAKTATEASSFLNKLLAYHDTASLGTWRNQLTFIADDEDLNLHLKDAEIITGAAAIANNKYLQQKIYLDAYPQESSSAGNRYPLVNEAIKDQSQKGTLIWNYNGHGGFRRLAEEVILEEPIINSWNNANKLPLFITATCDFAPYDNPAIYSLGENVLLREKTGAIALMTTTRLVFAFSNRIINENYIKTALQQKPDGSYYSLGDAVRIAKNVTYQTSGDAINNSKFTLLGDPAMTLAFPKYNVVTSTINGKSITAIPDTLKSLQKFVITGMITDELGNKLNNFNGTVYPVVYDKPATITTLANDADSRKENFSVQKNIIFKGSSSVTNGSFSFSFIIPKDIDYRYGNGQISYYAKSERTDANGVYENFIIGGSAAAPVDVKGPEIKAWLENENFVNGGNVGESPLLILHFADTSGINILGTGIGHDISVMLDDDPKKVFILNNFFECSVDGFRQGKLVYELPALKEGPHSLKIKAWDAANNSSDAVLEFRVYKKETFILQRVSNYPNPFSTGTNFCFELENGQIGEDIEANVQVYNLSGQLVRSLKKAIKFTAKRSCEIEWDGRNENGSKMGTGIYVYVLSIKPPSGSISRKVGKLYLF